MNLLEVKNISKTYGSGETAVKALKDVSFSVPKGEYVAIVGESGSGKSTLLNMIGALDTPTSGKVLIDGKDIFSMNDRKLTVFRRRNIGFIFQAFNLIPELTVEQNIIFPMLLDYQKPDKKYLEELLMVLNLKERRNHLPNQLSGGQQQRVAIGRALITRPALILADEPTGNLDTRNSSEVIALLKEASKKYEQTIIMITHNRSIAQTADRVLQVCKNHYQPFWRNVENPSYVNCYDCPADFGFLHPCRSCPGKTNSQYANYCNNQRFIKFEISCRTAKYLVRQRYFREAWWEIKGCAGFLLEYS